MKQNSQNELPKAFIDYWKGCVGYFELRATAKAYRHLMARLRQARIGKIGPPPGYETTPENAPGLNHPHGWSLANLRRYVDNTSFKATPESK